MDKSSTDASRTIAEAYAHQVVTVPWTPTVEETRTLALSLCRHEWILFMDDDEVPERRRRTRIRTELQRPAADIYEFPLRHYILGCHDERAYYWPEHHVRLFRRGAVSSPAPFMPACATRRTASMTVRREPTASASIILSHQTPRLDRENQPLHRPTRPGRPACRPRGFRRLRARTHRPLDGAHRRPHRRGYPAAVALLRAVYDMVDAVKSWEEDRAVSGRELFEQVSRTLPQRIAIDTERFVALRDCVDAQSTKIRPDEGSLPSGAPDWLDADALLPPVPGTAA